MGTIQSTQLSMGFKAAGQRPGCGNCAHAQQEYVDRMPPYDRAGLRCKRGGFRVSLMACCSEHRPKVSGDGQPRASVQVTLEQLAEAVEHADQLNQEVCPAHIPHVLEIGVKKLGMLALAGTTRLDIGNGFVLSCTVARKGALP